MSNVGKTLLRGHALYHEGQVVFDSRGNPAPHWPRPDETVHAKCECGELSPPGISQTAAKQWHRAHKDSLR